MSRTVALESTPVGSLQLNVAAFLCEGKPAAAD